MQIRVTGRPTPLGTQVKAYAEYRIFSRLAPLARRIGGVDVVLTGPAANALATCAVTADLGPAGSVNARVRRPQPIEAIDGAAAALADAIVRRLESRSEKGVRHGP
jgi:ribosome-associated translation inhibitor RaiA